jgi:hypothetical protein
MPRRHLSLLEADLRVSIQSLPPLIPFAENQSGYAEEASDQNHFWEFPGDLNKH